MAAPFNITLLAKKGGVGKSTTAILLYEVLRQAGRTVELKDWDAQGTSSKALELIHGHKPETVANPEIIIYDTPPQSRPHRYRDGSAKRQSRSGHSDPCPSRRLGG
jgi:cellulose biosynthesis protein BcsQ